MTEFERGSKRGRRVAAREGPRVSFREREREALLTIKK